MGVRIGLAYVETRATAEGIPELPYPLVSQSQAESECACCPKMISDEQRSIPTAVFAIEQSIVVNRREDVAEEIGSILRCVETKQEVSSAEKLGQ